MSSALMLVIAVIYLGASWSFLCEGKVSWAVVALSWSVGNAVLAYISR